MQIKHQPITKFVLISQRSVRVLIASALTLSLVASGTLVAQAQTPSSYTVIVAPTGNDSTGDGSEIKPFASIERACEGPGAGTSRGQYPLGPGATIMLRAGTYRPTKIDYVRKDILNGSSNAPIVIKGYDKKGTVEWPILDYSNAPAGEWEAGLNISSDYIKLYYLQVQSSRSYGIVLGANYNSLGAGRAAQVIGCVSTWNYRSGLRAYGRDHIVKRCKINQNVQINRDRILQGGWPAALEGYQTYNVLFEDNDVYENYGEGLLFQISDNCKVYNNRARDNYSVNIYSDSNSNLTIDLNTTSSSNKEPFYKYGVPAVGIQVSNEKSYKLTDRLTITRNNISNARFCFYKWKDGSGGGQMINTLLDQNTFSQGRSGLLEIDSGNHTGSWFGTNTYTTTSDSAFSNRIRVSGNVYTAAQVTNRSMTGL